MIFKPEKDQAFQMTVQSVGTPVKGKFATEYPLRGIIGSDMDALFYVKVEALDRQAERKGLNAQRLAGKVVHFRKTPDGYLNIEQVDIATGYEDQAADEQKFVETVAAQAAILGTQAVPVPQPHRAAAPAFSRERMVAVYGECVADAEQALAPLFAATDYNPVLVKDVATAFFIERGKRGAM
jgi:hypothetical protein